MDVLTLWEILKTVVLGFFFLCAGMQNYFLFRPDWLPGAEGETVCY